MTIAAYYSESRADKYNTSQLHTFLKQGKALDAGDHVAFPIADADDVKSAVATYGLTKLDKQKVRAHIITNAKKIGSAAMAHIPDHWNTDGRSDGRFAGIFNGEELRALTASIELDTREGKAISNENADHLVAIHEQLHQLHDSLVPLMTAAGKATSCSPGGLRSATTRSSGGEVSTRSWGSQPR